MRLETPEGPLPQRLPSRRMVAASIFTAGYALALQPAEATAITTPTDGLIIEEPRFTGAGGYALPSYVARPAGRGRHSAIIVVNEVFGIHAYIKDVCRRLARLGYVAIAPDYFDRAGDPSTATDFSVIAPIVGAATHEQVMGDTQGAITWLNAQRFVRRNRIGITGFCWGGAVVWMAAARFPEIRAGVAWYGRLISAPAGSAFNAEQGRQYPVDIASSLRAPVLGLYGGRDQGIPQTTVEQMRAALTAAGNRTHSEIIVYPEAEHGFHADYRPSYNEAAATDGWSRLQAWFSRNGL